MADSLKIDTDISYCPLNQLINQPLNISNASDQQLAFKIKTNHKSLLSMYINHGFLKPFSSLSIPVKLVQKVPQNVTVKLEVNWCVATAEMKEKKDSRMTTVSKQHIFKKVFPIKKQETHSQQSEKPQKQIEGGTSQLSGTKSEEKSVYESVYETRPKKEQTAPISPFQYQSKQSQSQKQTREVNSVSQQYKSSSFSKSTSQSNFSIAMASPSKNLEIVSQEEQEEIQEIEKQVQKCKNEQINQKRKIDELLSKIRKIQEPLKAKQFLDGKIFCLLLIIAFLFGQFMQKTIF